MIREIKLNGDGELSFGAIKQNIKQLMELNLIEPINAIDLSEYYEGGDYLEFLEGINDNLKNYKSKQGDRFILKLEF